MVIKYARNWKQLGRILEIDDNLLSIIEYDNHHDCETCCSKMLSEWLDLTPNASWKMLCNAINKIKDELRDVPDVVKQLNAAADNLPDTVEKLESAVYALPDAIDKLGTATGILPDAIEKLGSTVNRLPKTVDQLCEAANKLTTKPVDKMHIAEDINLDDFTGKNCSI